MSILILAFTAWLTAGTWQVSGNSTTSTEVLAVFNTADWCGACKALKPKLDQVKRDFIGKPVLFIHFDMTDEFAREQGARFAALLNLSAVYKKYEGQTGFITLVRVRTREEVGRITAVMTPDEIREQIQRALK